MEREVWQAIPGFEPYEISTLGRVRSPTRMLTISRGLQVTLGEQGNYSVSTIYRSVFGRAAPKIKPMQGFWISKPVLARRR
jgi:hypothetical protein